MGERQKLLRQFGRELQERVGPLVKEVGLGWSERNLGGDSLELTGLFEADDPFLVSSSLPHLNWPAWDKDTRGCVDLWVHFGLRNQQIWADLEGTDIGEWLRANGHHELANEMDGPAALDDAIVSLARGLELMLRGTGRG